MGPLASWFTQRMGFLHISQHWHVVCFPTRVRGTWEVSHGGTQHSTLLTCFRVIPWNLADLGRVLSSHSPCSLLLSASNPSVLLSPDCWLFVFIKPVFLMVLQKLKLLLTLISLSTVIVHPKPILLYVSGHFFSSQFVYHSPGGWAGWPCWFSALDQPWFSSVGSEHLFSAHPWVAKPCFPSHVAVTTSHSTSLFLSQT